MHSQFGPGAPKLPSGAGLLKVLPLGKVGVRPGGTSRTLRALAAAPAQMAEELAPLPGPTRKQVREHRSAL